MRIFIGLPILIAICTLAVAQSPSAVKPLTEPSAHLSDFQAIEFMYAQL